MAVGISVDTFFMANVTFAISHTSHFSVTLALVSLIVGVVVVVVSFSFMVKMLA